MNMTIVERTYNAKTMKIKENIAVQANLMILKVHTIQFPVRFRMKTIDSIFFIDG